MKTEELIPIVSKIKSKVSEVAGKVVYITVSGAHLYGFPSKDSDIDYRGSYIANPNMLLGLNTPTDCFVSVNPDYQMFELKKEIWLALKGNCNVLEHIFSEPFLISLQYFELKEMIRESLSKEGVYNSYRGMATFNYKKFILGGKVSSKKYLYVFRGLLAGRHFLETGIIQPNLTKLNSIYKIPELKKLIKAKTEGNETDIAQDIDSGKLDELIQKAFADLDKAYEKSKVQETPDKRDVEQLNSFLISERKKMLVLDDNSTRLDNIVG